MNRLISKIRQWIYEKQIAFVLKRLRGKSVLMTQSFTETEAKYYFDYEDEHGTPHSIQITHKREMGQA